MTEGHDQSSGGSRFGRQASAAGGFDSQRRLAIFVPSMRGGGAERSMLKVAEGIAECGVAVDLVLAQREGPYLADVPASVRLVDLEARRVLTSLLPLVRYLRRERPVAMLSAMNYANIIALWARWLARVPTRMVVSERITLSVSASQALRWRGRLLPQLVKIVYRWADGIVANSQGVADDLAQLMGIPRERITVIYNPVVTPVLKELSRAPVEDPWLKPGQPPVVLSAGRFRPQKDFPTLIRAFAQVRRIRPARLLLLGEGPERPALEALVRELGLEQCVRLPGFVTNPHAYMSRASVFVLSSRWEGLPGVLIEALYCGVPLVSTDCPSGPREILEAGSYGRLVPIGDVTAMARAIDMALCGGIPGPPPESWKRFELETVVPQYLDVLLQS